MPQKNSAENVFNDMQSNLQQMVDSLPAYPLDLKTIMETQRKNMQAFSEMNQRAMQGWQALAQRQSEMVSQFLQDNTGLTRQTFSEGSPEEKIAQQSEILKGAYERSLSNSRELAQMVQQCTKDAANIISKRVIASLNEISSAADKAE